MRDEAHSEPEGVNRRFSRRASVQNRGERAASISLEVSGCGSYEVWKSPCGVSASSIADAGDIAVSGASLLVALDRN
jgi:hypothetical protein